jgi:signal transduction histidine kinase
VHPYVFVPLAAAVSACAMAGAAWGRDPGRPSGRLFAAVLLGCGFWSLCQVAWSLSGSGEQARLAARLSCLGFLWLGPLSLHLHAILQPGGVSPRLRRGLPWAYAGTGVLAALFLATDWFVPDMQRVPWGWEPVMGPGMAAVALWVAAYPALLATRWAQGRRPPAMQAAAFAWVPLGLGVLVAVLLATEVVLPSLGFVFPRFGSAAMSVGSLLVAVELGRQGHVVTPRGLAHELVDAFPDGVALLGRGGAIRSANANLARLAGCRRSQLRGLPIARFLPDAPALEGSIVDVQTRFVDDAGKEFPVTLSASVLSVGEEARVGFVVAVRDLRPALQLRGRLVSSGRLAAVGELAASITHEINNPIAYVRTNLGVLAAHLDELAKAATVLPGCSQVVAEADEARETVADTLRGANRVASIVRDVRSFSGAGHTEGNVGHVMQLCEEALRVSLPRIPEGVSVVREYGDVPAVACAPRALVQVFLNLLTNAAQAVRCGGVIRIRSRPLDGRVVVSVEDDGPGIAADVVERIFDPFFTTKPVGEGTGLGLAISREIIEGHGGELGVEARSGGGTVFSVSLPEHTGPAGSGGGE